MNWFRHASLPSRSRRVRIALLLLVLGIGVSCHLWAQWHYRQAHLALKQRAFAGAHEHLTGSLRIWFLSPNVHFEAAQAARRAGAFDDADRLLRRCEELGGDSDAIHVERRLMQVQRGQLAGAEPELTERVRRGDPESVAILEVLAVAYFQSYQLAQAQECIRRWLELEPERVEAWLLRAQVLQRLQNRDEVLSCFEQVVRLDPENDEARLQLAGHLAYVNKPIEALRQFEYLRDRQGETIPILKGMACCYRALNRPQDARTVLERVLKEAPDDWRALAERGRLALEYESPAAAEPWLRVAVKLAPHETDLNYSFYQCLERQGKDAEADQVLARLKQVEIDLARVAGLSRDIGRNPHDAALRYEAGLILLRNGLESEGVRWLESALAEDPRHAPTHEALAAYFERSGNLPLAQEHRRLALAAAPNP